MAERLRELKIEVIVDTNITNHMLTFDIMDYDSLDELFEKAKEFTKEILPK
jgi:uncharacterized protein (UPF0264 family)